MKFWYVGRFVLLIIFLPFFWVPIKGKESQKADLIIFSYDRPLQLYAYLESIHKYIKGVDKVLVLYRVSGEKVKQAYDVVNKDFPSVQWFKQDTNPNNFKSLLLNLMNNVSQNPYVVFGVDDIMVTDDCDVSYCIDMIKQEKAYGFYLRLGKNIKRSYMMQRKIIDYQIPQLHKVNPLVYSWNFPQGSFDWAYPTSVDMTVIHKNKIKNLFQKMRFKSPNTLESMWWRRASHKQKGLCFERSKIVNIPLNVVQKDFYQGYISNVLAPEMLLEVFMGGFKIDIGKYHKLNNISPHMEIAPSYIPRTSRSVKST